MKISQCSLPMNVGKCSPAENSPTRILSGSRIYKSHSMRGRCSMYFVNMAIVFQCDVMNFATALLWKHGTRDQWYFLITLTARGLRTSVQQNIRAAGYVIVRGDSTRYSDTL